MRISAYLGILAPLVYIGTVILGGLLRDDYSHLAHAISELTVAGAPNLAMLTVLFTIYNALVALFGIGSWWHLRQAAPGQVRVATLLVAAIGLLGLILPFFPMDARGEPVTWQGTGHLVIAGMLSVLSIGTPWLAGRGFKTMPALHGLSVHSRVSALLILVSGALAAWAAGQASPYLGLLERVTIGCFLQWVLVTALHLRGSSSTAISVGELPRRLG